MNLNYRRVRLPGICNYAELVLKSGDCSLYRVGNEDKVGDASNVNVGRSNYET